MTYYRFILCLCVFPFFLSCQNDNDLNEKEKQENTVPNDYSPIPLSKSEQEISMQNLEFAFRFFKKCNRLLTDKSQMVFSPLSAYWAVSMASSGANSTTLQEFMEVLGCNELQNDDLHNYNRKLIIALTEIDNTCELGIANSVWIDKEFEVLDSYTEGLEKFYEAELFLEDLKNSSAVTAINDWCNEKTNGRIPKIVNKMDAETLLLLNSLYFKGIWKNVFDEKNTWKEAFTNEDLSITETDFMNLTLATDFVEHDLFTLAELPYGNCAYSMTVLLPNEGIDVNRCIEALNAESWATCMSEKQDKLLHIKLPKFNVKAVGEELASVLMKMGLEEAFSSKADFSRLSKKDVMMTAINQSVSFSIDEKGTEASAITDIEFGAGFGENSNKPQILDFHVNRPFIFIIKEQSTNSVLFMGKIAEL